MGCRGSPLHHALHPSRPAAVPGDERVDASSGELVLEAERYPRREENRRLLLEQLHQLILAGHAHAPLKGGFVFDRVQSPFA